MIVVNIFMAFNKEEVPFKCKDIIKKSIAIFPCLRDKGGYKVHPVPAPTLVHSPEANKNVKKEPVSNHNDSAFKRGKASSGVPT